MLLKAQAKEAALFFPLPSRPTPLHVPLPPPAQEADSKGSAAEGAKSKPAQDGAQRSKAAAAQPRTMPAQPGSQQQPSQQQ